MKTPDLFDFLRFLSKRPSFARTIYSCMSGRSFLWKSCMNNTPSHLTKKITEREMSLSREKNKSRIIYFNTLSKLNFVGIDLGQLKDDNSHQ